MSVSSITTTGSASASDASEFLQKMFARLDTDGDGKVTQDEFIAAMQKRFGSSDSTGSANRPDAAKIFQRADSDGDGSISLDEFKASFKAMRGSGGAHGTRHAHGSGGPPSETPAAGGQGGKTSASEKTPQVFDEMDTNQDGVVSLAELEAALGKEAVQGGQPTDSANSSNTADSSAAATASGHSTAIQKFFKAVDADGDGKITQQELASFFQQWQQHLEETARYHADGTPTNSTAAGNNVSEIV